MTDTGSYSGLRRRYNTALGGAESSLRALLGAPSSSWRNIATASAQQPVEDGLLRRDDASTSSSSIAGAVDGPVFLHRKRVKGSPDVLRATCHVPIKDPATALESFRAVLTASEARPAWDTSVEKQETLEIVEPAIKLVRTYTKIGWPSSARDFVAVQKVLQEPGKTLIHIAVSLPRKTQESVHDPPFLRPSPPYVRSHVHLCAFVVTFPSATRARLSMYWQWDLKGSGVVWTSHQSLLSDIVQNLVNYTRQHSGRMPYVRGWGKCISLDNEITDESQDRLTIDCSIYREGASDDFDKNTVLIEKGKERQRLERALEVRLPSPDTGEAGWNVSIVSTPALDKNGSAPWRCVAETAQAITKTPGERITLRVFHDTVQDYASLRIIMERLAGGKLVRINGDTLEISDTSTANTPSLSLPSIADSSRVEAIVKDTASIRTIATVESASSVSIAPPSPTTAAKSEAASDAQNVMRASLNRTYASFLSLLQAPAAKWRNVTEIRNVSVSTFSAIDLTATPIHKFESTFVNTTLWDVLSVCLSDGARLEWDRLSGLEHFELIGQTEVDVQEKVQVPSQNIAAADGMVTFWQAKWKGSWASSARRTLMLRALYKSPTSVHVFFSSVLQSDPAVDKHLFVKPPTPDPNTIESEVLLQAMAIDQISPTTTSLTIVDQTNPKGWSRSGYSAMANAVANIGDYVLKNGSPPLLTRLSGAHLRNEGYARDTGVSTFEYTPRSTSSSKERKTEAVFHCDNAIWSTTGVSLTVKPPMRIASVLLRHRLSERGSGCWITLEHTFENSGAAADVLDEQLLVTVKFQRHASDASLGLRDRSAVWINGEKMKVDVEEMKEEQVKELKAKKRIKNPALLLDRTVGSQRPGHRTRPSSVLDTDEVRSIIAAAPPIINSVAPLPPQPPMHYAFEGLAWLQSFYSDLSAGSDSTEATADWLILSHTENNSPLRISKRIEPRLSAAYPLYRVERTIPNVAGQDVMELVSSTNWPIRQTWDDRLSGITTLFDFQHGGTLSAWTAKSNFPLRSRVGHIASARAHLLVPAARSSKKATSRVLFSASASFPLEKMPYVRSAEPAGGTTELDTSMYNASKLSEFSVYLEGWIVETIDSLGDEDDDAPSVLPHTRCTYFTCTSMPSAPGQGAFSGGNVGLRFAKLFENLESSLRSSKASVNLRNPAQALQIDGSLQQPKQMTQDDAWIYSERSAIPYVIKADGEHTVVRLSLPKLGEPNKSNSSDDRSISNTVSAGPAATAKSQTTAPIDKLRPAPRPNNSTTSLTRLQSFDSDEPDTLVAELQFTRRTDTAGFDLVADACAISDDKLPLSTAYHEWDTISNIPWRLKAYPLSLPAGQASTYLVKLLLPTAQYVSPLLHPLSNGVVRPAVPAWYRQLAETGGLVHISVRSRPVIMQIEGRPSSPLNFTLNGANVMLATEGETKAILQELDDIDDEVSLPLVKLSRSNDAVSTERVPLNALSPVLVNASILRAPPPAISEQSANLLNSETPPSGATSPLVSSLGLSRRATRDASLGAAVANIEKATQPIVDLFTATAVVPGSLPNGQAAPVSERTYRRSFVILIAVISFLLGSLLRSLLSPGDYVFFTESAGSVDTAVLELLDPTRKWKYAMRLLQLPVPGFNKDIIAAFVEKS